MSLLTDLADTRCKRSKSAHKIAAIVVADPQAILSATTASLAARAEVSEPTVNRFCTGLGYKGFPDFKLALAAELARLQPRITRNIKAGDSTGKVVAKIFESTHASLGSAEEQLDLAALQDAVAALSAARAIVFCGLGASASVARDAEHKFLRFPRAVSSHTDIINQRMVATGLASEDCLVCISHTGRTHAIVDVARLAKENGCPVIGITAPGSPLARACTLLLGVETGEDTEMYTPMTSRIAQLVLVDILATCMALDADDSLAQHLQTVKSNLGPTRRG
ncbi:transcriptional regulator HexR [Pseudohalioglobus sediminis]|uniref:Transcriptional regulator HexR n=1 Tax=Pseudohalioglobus sediminis TaxID=2606449 RepID=A0A5B0WZG9_9GAMM|nr:transcriptional regulator HexR [Pseudohalioglobus sediminis]KAA1192470.1 transcriptional regulator HexR [Pseudohalioglobus sediminis]